MANRDKMPEPMSLEDYSKIRGQNLAFPILRTPVRTLMSGTAPSKWVPPEHDRNWHQLPQNPEAGEAGSGYYTYGTDLSGQKGTAANAQWGRGQTMRFIGAVADHLARGKEETIFGVGNISLEGGKSFKGPHGHKGHVSGLEFDVRPVRIDKKQEGVSYHASEYDLAATQRLVDAIRASGDIDVIYFNDSRIKGVTPSDETHDNHLHVRLKR